MGNLVERFKNPGSDLRGKPFWSWNGELDRDELLRQVYVMKEMGFGGFFMHSRTGLITEYLGEEWFKLINEISDEAEKIGMEAWLYDEDRWPSGTAGGIVTKNPEYRMQYLRMRTIKAEDFVNDTKTVACFAAKVDQNKLYSYKLIQNRKEAAGFDTVLVFETILMDNDSNYNGYCYLDTMNKDAVQAYIESTHEKYKDNCGNRLGSSIKGIFTDEPHHGALFGGFGLSDPERFNLAPYSYRLFAQFKERYGYDLIDVLPELFMQKDDEFISPVKLNYAELIQNLFLENFVQPIEDWCNENKMIFTGHFLHEDSLTCQVAMFGSLMRGYEIMSYPGVDVLTEFNYNWNIVKQLTSVARQTGKKWLLSELYGCTGWQFNFESHKNVGDWQALFGISLRCQHLLWYTMEGEGKRDYPASIFHQSSWYKEYKAVEDYFSRFNLLMMQGNPLCEVLYITPIESVMAQIGVRWCDGLTPVYQDIIEIEKDYKNISDWLYASQTDFDFGDEDMISRLYKIVKKDGRTLLCVGEAQYAEVVIGGMRTMRESTRTILKQFIDEGGRVIFVGNAPKYIDAVASDKINELTGKAVCVAMDKEELTKAVKEGEKAYVTTNKDGLFLQARVDENGKMFVVALNPDRNKGAENVVITILKDGYLENWDMATGERFSMGQSENGKVEITVDFAPGQEHVFVVNPAKENLPQKEQLVVKEEVVLDKIISYELLEENMLMLDMAEYRINGGDWQPKKEVLRVDRAVRDEFSIPHRGGSMLQPWYLGKRELPVQGLVELKFDFDASYIPTSPVYLCMERPDHFVVKVNGNEIKAIDDFWVDISFIKMPVDLNILKIGKNVVTIETKFTEATNLEALYLIGDFGVKVDGCYSTVIPLPENLTIGNVVEQGLPFYGGKINYKMEVTKTATNAIVELNELTAACVVVNPNKEAKVVGWQPYTANVSVDGNVVLQYILTRRNTFGPLHQYPLNAGGYGPGNFLTGGEGYKDDYNFYPNGMMKPATLKIIQ